MLKITMIIPSEEVNYLQRFAYEMEAQKRIVKELITDNPDNPAILENATYKKYHEAYQESAASFEIARDAIELKFVPEELRQLGSATNWVLNYTTNTLAINCSSNVFDKTYESIKFAGDITDLKVEVVDALNVTNCTCAGGTC